MLLESHSDSNTKPEMSTGIIQEKGLWKGASASLVIPQLTPHGTTWAMVVPTSEAKRTKTG